MRQLMLMTLLSVITLFITPDLWANDDTSITTFNENLIPTIDKSEMPPSSDPSFFSKLRQEMQKIDMEQAKKNQGEGTAHVLRHVKTNFVPDSITFAIAGGLVYFTQLQMVTKSDPALMVKHVEALKDPIAHISFGAFMVANGIYIDMKTRGLDPLTKQMAMKTLTYKGLAVGSFASSVTADLLVTMKECTKAWIENKNDGPAHAACDFAYKQWTVRNKFVQYAPQILSLLVSQAGSEVVETVGKSGGRFLKPGVKSLESKTIKFFKVTSTHVDLVVTGGGSFVVRSIRWFGKLTKFTMFLAIDHMVTPTVTRVGNNLIQPLFFDFDALAMNRYLIRGSKHNWSEEKAARNNESFAKFPAEIFNFTERMSAWRMHLNGKSEADLAGWLDAVSQLLHQIDYTKTFYLKYIENIYDTLNRQHLVQQGEFNDAPDRAWALERRYPYRTLPLYGVKSNSDNNGISDNDMYLLKPYAIEPKQSQFVQQTAIEFIKNLSQTELSELHKKEIYNLVKPLTANLRPYAQGQDLDRINQYLKNLPKAPQAVRGSHRPDPYYLLKKELKAFRNILGNPMPQLYEGSGFAMAFDTHVANYQLATAAKFDLKDENYKFAKTADYMLFHMICGPQKTKIEEGMFSGINLIPPRIINYREELEICKDTWFFKNVTSQNFHQIPITVDGIEYQNISRFMVNRINPSLIGNYRDIDKTDKGKGFDQWWTNNILPSLQTTLRSLDKRYEKLVEKTYQQVNDQKGFADFAIDYYTNQSYYLDRNIGDNLRYEFEVYLNILKSMLLDEKVTSYDFMKDLAATTRKRQFDIPYISDRGMTKHLIKENAYLIKTLGIDASEITSLDDIAEKIILPARENKILSAATKKLATQLNKIRVQELEMNYKNYMSLLRSENLKFEDMVGHKEKLYKSNMIIFGQFKQMAEMAGVDNLPTEVQTLLAVANGLEALEIEINRFLLMKVKLEDRLEIDMSQLNTFMKAQSAAPTQKRGASPHSH